MGTRLLLGLLAVLLAVNFYCSSAESNSERAVFVSGKSDCLDCAEKNVKTELAYEGLQVAIKCKNSKGDYEIKGAGKLDKNGDYKVQLPAELVEANGELMQECFAQLHSVANAPCPDVNGLAPSKIILTSKNDGVNTFSTEAKLPFSSATCASAFFWPHHQLPPLPKWHPFYKPLPKFPPKPYFPPKHYSPPVYKPPVPTYKPPKFPPKPYFPPKHSSPPVYKPPVPTYKPPTPVVKPLPPPVPIVKPLPPPIPIYKHPIYKKPLPPLPKFPPIYKKPLPPLPKFPPIYKKPLPPIPEYPPFYKKPLPPLPKFPPIYKKPCPPIPEHPPFYKKPWPPIPEHPPIYEKPDHHLPKYSPIYEKPPRT